jgi:DNA-binding LacI/PurR family transcriptional regulator
MNKKITINDIARALNISKSTVSRALRPNSDINKETRRKVLEFVEKNDYEPDQLAKSLRTGKSYTIGVIVPAYNIPFYAIAIEGIQDYAFQKGYNIMICHSKEQSEIEEKNVRALINSRVDGLIISVARDNEKNQHIRRLKGKGLPIVMFNRVIEDMKVSKVVVNDYYGSFNMTSYLLKRSSKNIAYITGPQNLLLSLNRKHGFLDALKKANRSINNDLIVEGGFTLESGYNSMRKLLESKIEFDTVFCVCDSVAFGAIKAIKDHGLKVPEDISVAGFTNEPISEIFEPSLTTVSQPIYEIGSTAARLLFNQIDDPEMPAELSVLETEIVIRNSTR